MAIILINCFNSFKSIANFLFAPYRSFKRRVRNAHVLLKLQTYQLSKCLISNVISMMWLPEDCKDDGQYNFHESETSPLFNWTQQLFFSFLFFLIAFILFSIRFTLFLFLTPSFPCSLQVSLKKKTQLIIDTLSLLFFFCFTIDLFSKIYPAEYTAESNLKHQYES